MKKIKTQKGFIQIPLLVMVIASIVVASVGTGVVLHKQGKLSSFTVNISEILKEPKNITGEELKTEEEIITEKTSESEIISEPEIKELQTQSQNLQNELQTTKQQLEQTQRQLKQIRDELESTQKAQKLTKEKARQEVERANAEAERAKAETEKLRWKVEGAEKLVEKQKRQEEELQRQSEQWISEFETAKLKVKQNEIFPLITGYKDSKGGCRCSSGYNKISCSGCPYFAENKLKVGEIIRMEVFAIPSKNSPIIEYRFEANVGQGLIKDWSNENFAEYTVPDLAYSNIGFTISVRNDYPRRRQPPYDDYIQISYEVIP